MLAKVYSFGISGLEAYPVTIEVDVANGLPAMVIVGLPDNAVKESRERVRAAIKNSGYKFPPQRITVNLSPADIKKEGPSFDLAIAVGILAATEQIPLFFMNDYIVLGELSLDGRIQPITGSLCITTAIPNSFKGLILPAKNAREASLSGQIPIFPLRNLNEVVHFLNDPPSLTPFILDRNSMVPKIPLGDGDFSDVKGHAYVKRGLEVAAAGGHNILLIGPPGSGKTMLAKRLSTILPDMSLQESLETTKIYSVMGLLKGKGLVNRRPFRSPHHTSSDVALVGGGSHPHPGEITLGHNGVLFLDELPEFSRHVLDALRQPLEDQCVTISRATKSILFPAKFMLVGAMNPCFCGQLGNPRVACRCSSTQIQKYRSKISGPLLDRIDIHLDVPAVNYLELSSTRPAESSAQIKERVNQARAVQTERFSATNHGGSAMNFGGKNDSGTPANAQMSHRQIGKFCKLGKEEDDLLKTAMKELNFSARAHDKILKVSRTIADLAGSANIETEHLAEAIQYRSLDRNWWG